MSEFRLIKVSFAKSFADTLEANGAAARSPLRKSGLSEKLINLENGLIPVQQLWDFSGACALDQGFFELGLLAGSKPFETYTDLGRELLLATTLYQALKQLIEKALTEDQTAVHWLKRERNIVWLCVEAEGSKEAARQFELYRYRCWLQIIRWGAGPDWLPSALWLQSQDDGELRDNALIRQVNVQFGRPYTAMAIEPGLLGKSLKYGPGCAHQKNGISPAQAPRPMEFEFETALRETIKSRVLSGESSVKDVARAFGIPIRTLQYRLKRLDLTYSQLLEQISIECAKNFLEEGVSVVEISRALGYKHATHFSRAFRRVCGISPSQYRSHHDSKAY